jgi:VCBS repeat-containing protein
MIKDGFRKTNSAPILFYRPEDDISADFIETHGPADPFTVFSTIGTLSFSDADNKDTHTASASFDPLSSSYPTALGSFQAEVVSDTSGKQKTGMLVWTYVANANALEFLGEGQTITQTYTIRLTDDKGGAATQTVTVTITGTNDAPILQSAIPDQVATEDSPIQFSIPNGTFADVDNGDTFHFSATLADGNDLPSWLTLNQSTGELLGSPTNADVGELEIELTATDSFGGEVSDAFKLTVLNSNDVPLGEIGLVPSISTISAITYRPLAPTDVTNPVTQVYNSDNGHVYEFVNNVVSWEQAFSLASASSISGVNGYLGTITSAAENAFVHDAAYTRISVGYYGSMWLGASDSVAEGSWYWVSGPEAGTQFWQGAGPNGIHGELGSPVDGQYSNWRGGVYDAPNSDNGEPGDENADYALMLVQNGGGEPLGTWEDGANSYTPVSTNLPGGNAYLIEYSGQVQETITTTSIELTTDLSQLADEDGLGPLSYQWQSYNGADWTDIQGATSSTYSFVDEGDPLALRLEIDYIDAQGTHETVHSAVYSVGDFLL